MAIAAIDALAADVVQVAELHGLDDRLVLPRHPGGAGKREDQPAEEPQKRDNADQAHSSDGVGTAWEDLTHKKARKAPRSYLGSCVRTRRRGRFRAVLR